VNVETLRTREERRREVFLVLTFGAVFSLIIWTVFLGQDLPGHYNADHWDVVWVGLDCGEALMLLATSWAAWRRRTILTLFSAVAGTLFLMDAWYDVTTARAGDFRTSLLMALLLEIPGAVALYWVSIRCLHRLNGAWLRQAHHEEPPRVWQVRLPSPDDVFGPLEGDALELE